ncbi:MULTISPECIES: ABC transporter permease [Musicola]|uniref:Binding-protein-dependent transport systems inner membrane component n=1 Tax=Musicola paradisiaca (strain Ech703) TaxID=579405 RepID=C6C7G1_MUSP7|nr:MULTISPECIES: ABC transporter permease [Musicola]ACS84079.1 binding-protein-dependent transport systems inner membrane component [Musicola paradisiaca Ech703]
MIRFLANRILQTIVVLFLVATVVFLITRIIPGDPATIMLGPQASVEAVHELRVKLGLDRSLLTQYLLFLRDLLRGDLGYSIYYGDSVINLILERLPNTLLLGGFALTLALLVAIPAGIISAVRQHSLFDYASVLFALIGVSMPVFWLGLLLVLLFSVRLAWLPATGMGDWDDGFMDVLGHLILPGVALSTVPMATFVRITRTAMLEVINAPYIRTARAKGLSEFSVIGKHAFRNAFNPILTVLGIQISTLLSGAVLTETIFAWPGMGRLIISSIEKRDFMVVQGTIMFTALIFVVVNTCVDLLYVVVNPKIGLNNPRGDA